MIHGELARLAAPEWIFLCVSGEKCLQTIWDEITSEFKDIQYLNRRRYATWDEPVKWLAPSRRQKTEESKRGFQKRLIQCQGWKVEQISFITGARSVNKQDLSKNLKFFRVLEASIRSIYSKIGMRSSNACIVPDSAGVQQGRRSPQMPL
jgi:hypothetical protein